LPHFGENVKLWAKTCRDDNPGPSFSYNYSTCFGFTQPTEVDWTDFGVDLASIPVAGAGIGESGVDVVNIAFANPNEDL
jgi:hypothetical protein